ncbi:MAG: hypothetical protein EOP40_03365 [Rubrivivax sp.]|nr:MAG: hypothetical protein EOP40_03365 [Rubrivivax sp.]
MKNFLQFAFCSALIVLTSLPTAKAATSTISVGQPFSYQNSSGQTLTMTYVGASGRITYTGGQAYNGTDPNTLQGFISVANVTRNKFLGNAGAVINESYIIDAFDEEVRVQARVTSPGKYLSVDTTTGTLISVGGLNAGIIQSQYASGSQKGGSLSVGNIQAGTSSNTIMADVDGISNAVGTTPSYTFTARNAGYWTYEGFSGTAKLPSTPLTRANIKSQLESAGFRVWSISNERITFSTLQKFSNLRLTPSGLDLHTKSLGFLSTWTNAMNSANQDPIGLGYLEVNVMLSMAMPSQ